MWILLEFYSSQRWVIVLDERACGTALALLFGVSLSSMASLIFSKTPCPVSQLKAVNTSAGLKTQELGLLIRPEQSPGAETQF